MTSYLITLDPPYELGDDAVVFRFRGWTEVNDEAAPDIEMRINGRPVPLEVVPRPQVRNHFPGIQVRGVAATVDFREALAGADTQQDGSGFLVQATLRSDHRSRTFEYAVTPGWMKSVFSAPLRPRPVPPAALQVRVAGAAAGEFCLAGDVAADRVETLLQQAGMPFGPDQDVLDFGAGPGRLISALAPRHRLTRFHGADIDPEAIGWAQRELGNLGRFVVNGEQPPLPYGERCFDVIYSLSTFTHMPEDDQFAWLDELRRVLKPRGLLLTTIMNPFAYGLPADVKVQADAKGFAYWADAPATSGLPDSYRLAYHSHDYVRRAWTRGFEVLGIGSHDLNGSQDSVLLRRI